jgi:hypothetical protein
MARASNTAVFIKQLGTRWARSGKGNDWNAWPADLRIREFPHPSRMENRDSSAAVAAPISEGKPL